MHVKIALCCPVGSAVDSFGKAFRRDFHFAFVCLAALIAAGCQPPSEANDSDQTTNLTPQLLNVPDSTYRFESCLRLTAGGTPITVESPGYACPTVADVDGDGVDDLVVGQFAGGKMKWYRNTANETKAPEYAVGKWIQCDDEPAEVPGVY